ncbi:MAG: PD-(D/E)XK nuclease-like domain-containing protein [Clostridia bacterium]
MTNKEYHSHSAISKSRLNTIGTSPLHFKWEQDNQKEDTASFAFGRAAHKWILEKSTFFDEFAIMPKYNLRTTIGKEQKAVFMDNNENKEIIDETQFEEIKQMDLAITAHPTARKLLTGRIEQSFFWTDTDTNESCKCRPDVINDELNVLVDYKSAQSCQDGHFERDARRYGYDLQAGMYCEGLMQCEFENFGFAFVAQEKKPPYAVRVYMCDTGFIEQGYDKFREYISIYHECKVSGNWYGYEGELSVETTLFGE